VAIFVAVLDIVVFGRGLCVLDYRYQYNAVFSIFPISEEKHRQLRYSPFLLNVRKEGIPL
jgi:hypothetical protein